MSRTEVAAHLIHAAEPSREDDSRLDALCRIAFVCADPIVYDALNRETVETAANVWVEEAAEALEVVLKSRPKEFAASIEDVKRALSSSDGKIPLPDTQEAAEHSHDLSRVMIGSWLEILRRDLLKAEVLFLSPRLLPEKQNPEAFKTFIEATSSFVINGEQLSAIMESLRRIVLLPERPTQLPNDIVLLQRSEREILANVASKMTLKNPLNLTSLSDTIQHDYWKKVSEAGRLKFSWRNS